MVYFLSDRDGPVSLFSYDTLTKQVRQVLANEGFDLKTLGAGPGALVYEQFGSFFIVRKIQMLDSPECGGVLLH